MNIIATIVFTAIQLYMAFIFVWVLGSWFPQWKGKAWYRFVEDVVKPYMQLFNGIPLKMGMIDFRPMLAIFVLIIVERLLLSMVTQP
jgi:YggT family protein